MMAITTSNSIRVNPRVVGRSSGEDSGRDGPHGFAGVDELDLLGVGHADADLLVLGDDLPRHPDGLPPIMLGRVVDARPLELLGVVMVDDDGEVLRVAEVRLRVEEVGPPVDRVLARPDGHLDRASLADVARRLGRRDDFRGLVVSEGRRHDARGFGRFPRSCGRVRVSLIRPLQESTLV